MIPGLHYFRILFILIFQFGALRVAAQPTLPGIAGSADKGIVILSWVCQYNGLKSVTVLRSTDSLNNYSAIGHVKKRDKGVQAFVDGHPVAGKNFYKLAIIFSSGLSWSSNHCSVYVDRASLNLSSPPLPENDSLQQFIVTEDLARPAATDAIATSVISIKNARKNSTGPAVVAPGETKQNVRALATDRQNSQTKTDTPAKNPAPEHKIHVAFEMDSSDMAGGMHSSGAGTQPHKKITVTFEDPGTNSLTFVKSRYVFIDPATGHVNLDLPDDIKTHHYSLKFYDEHDHVIMEVPRINVSKIIIDKRNFQHPGVYKFILRKDVTELERGYIEIKPL